MRITIINQFYVPDIAPTAHLSASLAEHFASQGYEVTVVTSRGGYSEDAAGAAGASGTGAPVRVKRLWTPKLGKGSHWRRVVDYACFYAGAFLFMAGLRRQDVVISLTTPPLIAWSGVVHTWLHPRARLVLWNMDCYPELPERAGVFKHEGLISKALQFLNRGLFKRLDHLVCLDTAMVNLLMERYEPRHELPTTIIPNWEDADFFPDPATSDEPPETWEGVERHGLADKFVVLYLGNMGYGHDFATVLDAAEQLKDTPSVVILFIGGGKRKDPTADDAKARGLDNVIVQGYVPKSETPSVMACAGCALITLRDDMLGVMSPSKMHSNLAMRLPIAYVGPETSNVDDAITKFDAGVSIRIGDADRLADEIRSLATNADRLASMRSNARRAFDEAYNDRATHAQFDRVIESLSDSGANS